MVGARLLGAIPTPPRPWYVDTCQSLTIGTVRPHYWWYMPLCRSIRIFILYRLGHCNGMFLRVSH